MSSFTLRAALSVGISASALLCALPALARDDEPPRDEQQVTVIGQRATDPEQRPGGADRVEAEQFEDKVAVSLADGRQLVIEPRQDNRAPSCEVFVRAGHGPMLIACLGRADSPLHVDFQIRPIVRVSDHRSGSSGPPSIEAMTRG